jgi:hypothetical protein
VFKHLRKRGNSPKSSHVAGREVGVKSRIGQSINQSSTFAEMFKHSILFYLTHQFTVLTFKNPQHPSKPTMGELNFSAVLGAERRFHQPLKLGGVLFGRDAKIEFAHRWLGGPNFSGWWKRRSAPRTAEKAGQMI